MRFYFSTRHIPQIKHLTVTDRISAIETASKRLTVPEKTLLNLLNLCVIVGVFSVLVMSTQNWLILLWTIPLFLFYPLLLKPALYTLSAKYLPSEEHGHK